MRGRPRPDRRPGARRAWARLLSCCAAFALPLFAGYGTGETFRTTAEAETVGMTLHRIAFRNLPGWGDDAVSQALPALRASCSVLDAKPADAPVGPNGVAGTAGEWRAICTAVAAAGSSDDALRHAFETRLVPFAVAGPDGLDGLFTGYYEPELRGSRKRSAAYVVPLYRQPSDLITVEAAGETRVGRMVDGRLQPYHTRKAIDAGALAGQGLELLWVADPIDAFFLQTQGSGRVRLAEGGSLRVGYAASNGHPPTIIGRILVERGELPKETATMQTVRQWLRDHPPEATALMQMNARYIFFREIRGDGPIGALGVALTPGRSLAVDPNLLPLGAPLWLDTTYPAGTPEAGQPLRRLVTAQDSGAAIKGAVRGDLYWGSGDGALRYAGPMRQRGRYYLLLPKAVADRM
jgi:membrane-bound lytic murein transglycosylase A